MKCLVKQDFELLGQPGVGIRLQDALRDLPCGFGFSTGFRFGNQHPARPLQGGFQVLIGQTRAIRYRGWYSGRAGHVFPVHEVPVVNLA